MNFIYKIKNMFLSIFNKKKMLPETINNVKDEQSVDESKRIENKDNTNKISEKNLSQINQIKYLKDQCESLDKTIEEKSKVLYATLTDIEKLTEDAV